MAGISRIFNLIVFVPSELLAIRSLSKINQREFNPNVFILKLRTTRKVKNNNTERLINQLLA
ncbi:MAG: hypothetical protein M3Q77_07375 [Thermoproteota archaeon]|nr:hypothetical protein [Thermoproteota archaeon]